MKRIVSLILICCLAMTLSVGAYAATSYTGGLSLSADTVEQGQTVELYMSMPAAALATLQFGISFDTEYLEVTAIDAPGAEDLTGYGIHAYSEDLTSANESGLLTFAYVGEKGDNKLEFGKAVVTITFKALKVGTTKISIAGDADMPLIMENLKDDGYTPKTQYAPKTSSVELTIEEPAYVLGDANGDGEVTITDAAVIAMYDAGLTVLDDTALLAADVNGDGEVTITDAAVVAMYDAGLVTEF